MGAKNTLKKAFSIMSNLDDPATAQPSMVLRLPDGFSLESAKAAFAKLVRSCRRYPTQVVKGLNLIAKKSADPNPTISYSTCLKPDNFKNVHNKTFGQLSGAPSYTTMMDWFGRQGNLRLIYSKGIACLLDKSDGHIRAFFQKGDENLVESVVKYGKVLYEDTGVLQDPCKDIIPLFAECFVLSNEIVNCLSRVFQNRLSAAVAGESLGDFTGNNLGPGAIMAQKSEIKHVGQLGGQKTEIHHHHHHHHHSSPSTGRRSRAESIDSTASDNTFGLPRPPKVARLSIRKNDDLDSIVDEGENIPEDGIHEAVGMVEPAIPGDLDETILLTLEKPFKVDYADAKGWHQVDKYEHFTVFAGMRDGKKAFGISCTGLSK